MPAASVVSRPVPSWGPSARRARSGLVFRSGVAALLILALYLFPVSIAQLRAVSIHASRPEAAGAPRPAGGRCPLLERLPTSAGAALSRFLDCARPQF